MYIRGNDGVVNALKFSLKSVTFSDCSADKGEHMFMSLASGREQIQEDKFSFDMEEIYGKPNFILLEERKDGIGNIIDLLNDETKRLPYSSRKIYVGGEASSQEKTCGRKEEPCDLLKTGKNHLVKDGNAVMFVTGRVTVDEPFVFDKGVILSSAINDYSILSHENEQKRGILRVGAKVEAKESKAVFEIKNYDSKIEHIDVEYPDAIEGDVLDIIYDECMLKITDVVFRPWKTELKGENVLGGEGKSLPYKLIVFEQSIINVTSEMEEIKPNSGIVEEVGENDNPLCSWDSGLIFINQGSDGTEGKPLGMISSVNVNGSAIYNTSSLFFIPVLLNVSLEKEFQRNANGMVYQTNGEYVIAVVSGEYLFPCGLTFEASKKRKDQELKWIDCPISEYVNETKMNVKIPKSVLDVDDYTSVVCRLSYPNGVINEEKSKSQEFVFVKPKKEETANDEPKDKKSQIIIIAVVVSIFVVVVAVVTAIVAVYIMKIKKRNRYKAINDITK
ncbi:uncharacterized protein MONOS_17305 [Monocercomonoides exilis]|uniref:uncharacterized protein n=1 Tax=Monocercomonoides exilis TaxID=2049356 RepID=UPI003559F5DA|nr:hypothetical protein MONOS_17305 [Monocercomonoides exilis]